MGFHEDDRIRRKNIRYNTPTPEINQAARKLIFDIGLPNNLALIEKLESLLSSNDDDRTRQVVKTAILIAKTE